MKMDEAEILEKRRLWRNNIPNVFNGAYRKKYDKGFQNSRKSAIESKCLDCMCWQSAEVMRCEHVACSLWPYRRRKRTDTKKIV